MSSDINDMLRQLLEGQKKIVEEQQSLKEEQKRLSAENAEFRNSLNITPVTPEPVATSTPCSTTNLTPPVQVNSNVRRRVIEPTPKKPSSPCRLSVRTVYKALMTIPSFGYDISTSDLVNIPTTERLVKAVVAENDGRDKCPWSKTEIKMAAKSYFRSLKERKNKENRGTTSVHKQKARRQGRKRERKDRYLKGLKKIKWTEEAKKKMETALQKYDIVSSDESECEDDELPSRNVVYKIRKLKFLSTKAQKMKRELYKCYVGSLPKPLQANFKQRKYVDGLFSDRTAPENCPSWLLKTTDE